MQTPNMYYSWEIGDGESISLFGMARALFFAAHIYV